MVLGTKHRHAVDSPPKNLAAVTPYFNFGRSRNRMRNYRQFAAHLAEQGVPLWTIEAALPGDPFDVAENDRVRRVRVREPLWLSERLINVLWPALPPEVDAVAWVDADLLFEPGIAEATLAALRRWPIVQLFQRVCWLDGGGTALPYRRDDQLLGIGYRNFRERASTVDSATRRTGFAWAARRELLEAMGGLFDRYPAGGGDVLSCIGFFGDLHAACLARYGSAVVAEVRNWAAHAGAVVRGRVGYVPGTIRHLYHGQLCHRNYLKRHQVWQAAGFDPAIHLELVEGLYQFSPRCPPEIRQWTAAYLGKLRREDES